MFEVTWVYCALNAVQGGVEVARAALTLALKLQDAAEERRARGLSTLPEVSRREQSARADYALEEAIAVQTDARTGLWEVMGVRPTTPIRVAGLAGRKLPATMEDTADKLVDRALEQGPGLLARGGDPPGAIGVYPRIVVAADVARNIGRIRTDDIPGGRT